MREAQDVDLTGVAETLLATVYVRALESQRPDALLKDDRAVELVGRLGPAFSRIRRIRMDEEDRVTLILRNREFDRYVRDFLAGHSDPVVVHIGGGLDARFERVDDGRVCWYDLDLSEVIELRRRFLGEEPPRHHLLACSVLDTKWCDEVAGHRTSAYLFVAEGVFMYFDEAQVRALVLALRDRFPAAELIFDAFSPFLVRANNFRFWVSHSGLTARYRWGLKRGEDVEKWGQGIRLVDRWFPLDQPEPRLARVRWMRHVPFLARVIGIYRYRFAPTAA
jgi:O-methyltransferase involved in polyketide biosynthesis